MAKISLRGVIDMHVHSSPDIRQRTYDDIGLMEAGIRSGARAIVIKSHQGSTVERAFLCNRHNELVHHGDNDFQMFGSITLNRTVGGVNPAAVETALALGGKVVWLPTSSARNHLKKMRQDPAAGVECVRGGTIVPELKEIFRLIRDHDAVLGTGHVSPEECFLIVDAARSMGVKKIVVTHPEWWLVGMSMADQLRLVREYDVILERCFAQNMGGGRYKSNLPDNLEAIRTVGYKNIMISTDGGQTENPNWEIAYAQYMQYMADHGVTEEALRHMTRGIQTQLLDLDENKGTL